MKFLVLVCGAALVWLSAGAGCASVNRLGGVAVTLVSVTPQQSSLFETTARMTLRFTNEGGDPLPLSGSAHRIHLNGTYVGRAVSDEHVTLPRLGSTTQTVTAHFDNLAMMRKAQELGNVPRVEYRIDSQLHVAERGGTIGATATGQLDLSGFMAQASASESR